MRSCKPGDELCDPAHLGTQDPASPARSAALNTLTRAYSLHWLPDWAPQSSSVHQCVAKPRRQCATITSDCCVHLQRAVCASVHSQAMQACATIISVWCVRLQSAEAESVGGATATFSPTKPLLARSHASTLSLPERIGTSSNDARKGLIAALPKAAVRRGGFKVQSKWAILTPRSGTM